MASYAFSFTSPVQHDILVYKTNNQNGVNMTIVQGTGSDTPLRALTIVFALIYSSKSQLLTIAVPVWKNATAYMFDCAYFGSDFLPPAERVSLSAGI
jgi:hypothetical protein